MMKLFSNPASPYVRKVLVFAAEAGIADRLVTVPVTVLPTATTTDVTADNPLAKIPTLVLESGESLFDSRVIIEYLATLTPDHRLLPVSGPERFRVLRAQALADGLLDAALLARYETFLRPENLRWPDWVAAQMGKIDRALDHFATLPLATGDDLTLVEITLGSALGYLDFRFPGFDWRTTRPGLAAFFAAISQRPSFTATVPPAA